MPLHFVAEAKVTGAFIHRLEAFAAIQRGAEAVLHAVITRQVGTRFGSADQVVDRYRGPGMWQVDVDERRSLTSEDVEGLDERRLDLGIDPLGDECARHANPQATYVP
jgi:hypothetical protein